MLFLKRLKLSRKGLLKESFRGNVRAFILLRKRVLSGLSFQARSFRSIKSGDELVSRLCRSFLPLGVLGGRDLRLDGLRDRCRTRMIVKS